MKLNEPIYAKKKANGLYLYKGRLTQLNLGLIKEMNQKKFAPNLSPFQIKILDCAPISILGITFNSVVQLR